MHNVYVIPNAMKRASSAWNDCQTYSKREKLTKESQKSWI